MERNINDDVYRLSLNDYDYLHDDNSRSMEVVPDLPQNPRRDGYEPVPDIRSRERYTMAVRRQGRVSWSNPLGQNDEPSEIHEEEREVCDIEIDVKKIPKLTMGDYEFDVKNDQHSYYLLDYDRFPPEEDRHRLPSRQVRERFKRFIVLYLQYLAEYSPGTIAETFILISRTNNFASAKGMKPLQRTLCADWFGPVKRTRGRPLKKTRAIIRMDINSEDLVIYPNKLDVKQLALFVKNVLLRDWASLMDTNLTAAEKERCLEYHSPFQVLEMFGLFDYLSVFYFMVDQPDTTYFYQYDIKQMPTQRSVAKIKEKLDQGLVFPLVPTWIKKENNRLQTTMSDLDSFTYEFRKDGDNRNVKVSKLFLQYPLIRCFDVAEWIIADKKNWMAMFWQNTARQLYNGPVIAQLQLFKPDHPVWEQFAKKHGNAARDEICQHFSAHRKIPIHHYDKILDTFVYPILDHIREVWCAGDPEDADWVVKFLANVTFNQEEKLGFIMAICSVPGIGKNILDPLFHNMMGQFFQTLQSVGPLLSNWSTEVTKKFFIIINEVSRDDYRKVHELLKTKATESRTRTEEKFERAGSTHDCASFAMFSNNKNAIEIGPGDRRMKIIQGLANMSKILSKEPDYYVKLGTLVKLPDTAYFFREYLKSIYRLEDDMRKTLSEGLDNDYRRQIMTLQNSEPIKQWMYMRASLALGNDFDYFDQAETAKKSEVEFLSQIGEDSPFASILGKRKQLQPTLANAVRDNFYQTNFKEYRFTRKTKLTVKKKRMIKTFQKNDKGETITKEREIEVDEVPACIDVFKWAPGVGIYVDAGVLYDDFLYFLNEERKRIEIISKERPKGRVPITKKEFITMASSVMKNSLNEIDVAFVLDGRVVPREALDGINGESIRFAPGEEWKSSIAITENNDYLEQHKMRSCIDGTGEIKILLFPPELVTKKLECDSKNIK